MGRIEELGAWPARACWVVLALVAGGPLGDAVDARSAGVQLAVAALAWAGWAAGLVALLVPRSAALTAVRLVVPAAVPATAWAALAGPGDGPSTPAVLAIAVAVAAAAAALAPWVAEAFVDGSAYGPERRTPLRTPVVFQLVLAPLAWALAVGGAVAGPLLLGAQRWVPGGLALVAGWALAAGSARSLHQLARRWVVLVPAGLVLHDPLTMPEPQLFLRETIARVGPAEAGTPDDRATEDLTAGAAGLVLELVLAEPVDLLVRIGRGSTETRSVDRVLFTPSRPAGVLRGAQERRIPVA